MIDFSRVEVIAYFLLVALLIIGWVIFFLRRLLRRMSQARREKQQIGRRLVNHTVGSPVEASVAKAVVKMAENPVKNSVPPDFASQLTHSTLERSLQGEVGHLRQEMQQLRTEVTHLATEVRQMKMVHNVSPVYAEAVTLAQQGISTVGIADRCGISLGEAELVVALAQSEAKGGFDDPK
jgi:hypothetical protein